MHILRRWLPVVPAAVALLMLAGCSNQPVAIVNGSRITKQDFYDRLEQAGGEKVLADLIARRLLNDAFNKSGLTLTEQEINAEVEKMKKQAPGAEEWQAFLQQQGLDEAGFREYVAFNLKVKKLAEKDVKYTEQDLVKHFDKYKQQFAKPETVKLSEIVLPNKAVADKIREQLNDPKADFATVAKQNSLSRYSAERGGARGEELALASIQPDSLRKAVASLPVGGMTQPVKIEGFWYILKLDQRNAAQKADYAKIKEQVREHYLLTHAKQVQDLIEDLRKSARVKVLHPKYQGLSSKFGEKEALPSFGAEQKGAPGAKAAPGTPPQQPAAPATQQPAAPAQPAAPTQ